MAIGTTAAILGATALSAGANIIGGKMASDAQGDAARAAEQAQLRMYTQTRQDLEPWRAQGQVAGQAAINMLGLGPAPGGPDIPGGVFGGFQTTPGYQFRRDEGIGAIDASAASRGNLFSGATMKAAQRYGDGLAAAEFDSYYNRLTDMSNRGQNSAAQVGAFGAGTAARQGNLLGNIGDANASGILSMTNGVSQFAGALGGAFGQSAGRQSGFAPAWRP